MKPDVFIRYPGSIIRPEYTAMDYNTQQPVSRRYKTYNGVVNWCKKRRLTFCFDSVKVLDEMYPLPDGFDLTRMKAKHELVTGGEGVVMVYYNEKWLCNVWSRWGKAAEFMVAVVNDQGICFDSWEGVLAYPKCKQILESA